MLDNSGIKNGERVVIIVGLLILSVLLGMYIASERLDSFEITARVQVAEQQAVLSTIAETIARNGADSVTESVVKDCAVAERMRFDALLGRLDSGLSQPELAELNQLFGLCASFFADRKALMVVRFEREFNAYQQQVDLLDTVTLADEHKKAQLEEWRALLVLEQEQSQLFTELVSAQKQIIDELISGKSSASAEIVAILTTVAETREALMYSRQQADNARSKVTSL